MTKTRIHMVSLGCPKNQVDAEVMTALLVQNGYALTPRPDEARIIVVNTCAFILPAKEESIEEILLMAECKKTGACEYLIVTGCLPQRYGKALEKEIPEVDLFLGLNEVPEITRHIEALIRKGAPPSQSVIRKPSFLMTAAHPRLLSKPSHTAYLKIADGCSNGCSYCVIPAIRGRQRSRPLDDLLAEAQRLADHGVREIVLTAQDTTAYGRDLMDKPTISDLLRHLNALDGIRWIRLLYTHPAGLTDDLLRTITAEDKVCPYIDMPIQHIDNTLLKSMNRRVDGALIRHIITKARITIPDVALRTSLIVGFPGESRVKFNNLVAFIRESRFDHLGVFTYSREEGTPAAAFSSRISEKEKDRRRQVLMEEQAEISREINQSIIGTRQEVLIEGPSDDPDFPFIGRSRRQAPEIDGQTYVKGKRLAAGRFVACRINAASEYDLYAEAVESDR